MQRSRSILSSIAVSILAVTAVTVAIVFGAMLSDSRTPSDAVSIVAIALIVLGTLLVVAWNIRDGESLVRPVLLATPLMIPLLFDRSFVVVLLSAGSAGAVLLAVLLAAYARRQGGGAASS